MSCTAFGIQGTIGGKFCRNCRKDALPLDHRILLERGVTSPMSNIPLIYHRLRFVKKLSEQHLSTNQRGSRSRVRSAPTQPSRPDSQSRTLWPYGAQPI